MDRQLTSFVEMLDTRTGVIDSVEQRRRPERQRVELSKVDKNIEEERNNQPESEALPCDQNTKHHHLLLESSSFVEGFAKRDTESL